MKARKVRGLDVGAPLADNAERIVRMRLEELHGFVPAALDVAEVEALHDMRIAAKRLRYVLEVTATCFGPYARTAAKRTRDLQDVIGEIHDCDVALPRVRRVAAERRAADADALAARAGEGAGDLDPALAADAPHADEHRGLATLEAYLVARRQLLYGRFLRLWRELGREGFRARLEYALGERPAAFTSLSPDGNDAGPARS
ncbi:CHAD domain-containing protein [Patulibacter sp. SYSU D01012]|uniref:CHAD domain-containing protein n=1 Tax=Patulibacter sp. SYSU D01012 TaxID=2817381 RepID=UPI0032BF7CD5